MTVLVLGAGLAGAWTTLEFLKRGVSVSVYDDASHVSASRVAAGLINPATGTKPKSTWMGSKLIPFAEQSYRSAADYIGVDSWTSRTIRRPFITEKDKHLWNLAVERGLELEWKSLDGEIDGVQLPFGGSEYNGATIDTVGFLDGFIAYASKQSILLEDEPELDKYDLVVWTQGWSASKNDLWSWLPFQPVKGEILDVEIAGPQLNSVYIRGMWIVPSLSSPRNGVQQVRIGATHDWDNLDERSTLEAKDKLIAKATAILGRDIVVTGHQAAVRPASRSKRPFVGKHPDKERHAIVNGLGSKGSLWAPWAARQLVDNLLDNEPLNDEVNILRWWEK